MSELQNRIVERLAALGGLQDAGLASKNRERLMTSAVSLFFAAGGNVDELKELITKADNYNRANVSDAVAQMVVATAAVSAYFGRTGQSFH